MREVEGTRATQGAGEEVTGASPSGREALGPLLPPPPRHGFGVKQ